MKKIMFGVIGLLALVVVLILFNPGFTAISRNVNPQVVVEEPVVVIENETIDTDNIDIIEEEELVAEPTPQQAEPVAEEIVEEPVEEPAEEIAEPDEEVLPEMTDDIEEIIIEPELLMPVSETEEIVEIEPQGDIFFGEEQEENPAPVQTPVVYVYEEEQKPVYSNKGFFFQTGMYLGAGLNDYEGNTSLLYSSGAELKVGAFFTEKLGAYVFARPDFFAEIRNISTFISIPNSLNVTAGAGIAAEFGKFGISAQAGYSILNIGLMEAKPYAFVSAAVTPEYIFVQQDKTKVKITLPLMFDMSATGYDAIAGVGLSVKWGGKIK